MNFNEYWNAKAQKKRKSWKTKTKRYAENHTGLEVIRKEVYLPLDFNPMFRLDDLKTLHFTGRNPLIKWDEAVFSFSEENLRTALQAQEADISTFKMEVSHESIQGKAAPLPQDYFGLNQWEDYRYCKPNRVFDFDKFYFDWLLRIYNICTDMETVHLSYKQVSMTIRRYSNATRPFAYYELNPCEQLCHSAILFQETDFYTLDTATLLMEMAAEWELRHEELNYYAKSLKLRSMEAATIDGIEFEPWDEKKVNKKTGEYIKKGYSQEKIVQQLLLPWKSAVKKYFDAQTEVAVKENVVNLEGFVTRLSTSKTFIETVFCAFLEKDGDDFAEIVIDNPFDITITVSGSSCRMVSLYNGIYLYPNANFENCTIKLSEKTPLNAISGYLKMMPAINRQIDDTIIQAVQIFDRRVTQNKVCQDDLVYLETLMKQYAGKPVGKLVKYIRWNLEGINDRYSIPLQSVKIKGDYALSFILKHTVGFARSPSGPNKLKTVIEDTVVDRWLDEECHHLYATDPCVEDGQNKKETGAILSKRTSWTIQEFASHYLRAQPVLSIEFIDQKL